MIITEIQYASLVISLSTLGQTDLAGNDPEALRTLAHLLSEAAFNVRRTLANSGDRQQHQIEQQNEDRMGWLNMSNGEEVP